MRNCATSGIVALSLAVVACTSLDGLTEGSSGAPPGAGGQESVDSNAADIAVQTSGLDFGSVSCASASPVSTLFVVNKTDAPRKYSVEIPEGSPFHAKDPLTGTLEANGTRAVRLIAEPVVAGAVKATILVRSGTSFVGVPATVTGTGASLEWSTMLADIGETPLSIEGSLDVKLMNRGTAPTTITGFEGRNADFTTSTPSSFEIAPNAAATVKLLLTKGSAASGKLNATIKPMASALCAPAPMVTVTGSRVDTLLTVKGADWGRQDCNSTPGDVQNVVISNYAPKPLKWTLVNLPAKYRFDGASTSGTVPGMTGTTPGLVSIPFKAPILGTQLGSLEEEIAIDIANTAGSTYGAPLIGTRNVKLRTDVRGAILSITPTMLTFTATPGSIDSETFTVKNTGNEIARVSWAFSRTAGGPAWVGLPGTMQTNPSATTTAKVSYQPNGPPPSSATLTPSFVPVGVSGGKICNAPSALVPVSLYGKE